MREEIVVPATRRGEPVTSRVWFAAGEVCVVEIRVGGELEVRGVGPDLFEALASARRSLEADGVVLACNGARRDVFPSAMQRQAAGGRYAYVLEMPRSASRPPVVDIFALAPESSVLATVDEQRDWFDRWRQTGSGEGGSP